MKKPILIAAGILVLLVTHAAVWCFGWQSGYTRMGWTDARTRMRMHMHTARSLRSNDLARANQLVDAQLRWDIERFDWIETNRWNWFTSNFELTLDEMCVPDDVFRDVSIKAATEVLNNEN